MIPNPSRIDGLKKIIIEGTRKFDKYELARECMSRLTVYEPVFKDIEHSEKPKAQGNRLYGQKNLSFAQLYEILILFNKSIAFAPKDSKELAGAYANKSAVLLRMRKYQECIREIDQALKITESMALKIKLLCRRAECLTALGLPDNRSCLQKAKFAIAKLEGTEEAKVSLNKLVKKTESIIDKGKLDIPNEEKRKKHALAMIEEAEERDISESLKVEYLKKCGKHLVAARDFEPGDIIIVEKPYINCLDESMMHQYCDYCFHHLWTAVPCDDCSRSLYCSEQCRIAAWTEYHESECFAITCMWLAFESEWDMLIPFLVKIFCKALKEAGSIEQLASDLEASYQCEGDSTESVPISSDFTTYKGIFTLPTYTVEQSQFELFVKDSIVVLVGLAKYTEILGKSYGVVEMKKLMKDDRAILVGALILKFAMILGHGCPMARLIDPNRQADREEDSFEYDVEEDDGETDEEDDEETDEEDAEYIEDSKRVNPQELHNLSCPTLILHTLSGCVPNVEFFSTHGNKFVLCAIRPIGAGEQLIIQAKYQSIWSASPRSKMPSYDIKEHCCARECRACTEGWLNIVTDGDKLSELLVADMRTSLTVKLWDERNSILSYWKANRGKPSFPDTKILFQAIDLVAQSWKYLSMPSAIIIRSVGLLMRVLQAFYDRSEICVKARHLRPRNIEIQLPINLFLGVVHSLDMKKSLEKS